MLFEPSEPIKDDTAPAQPAARADANGLGPSPAPPPAGGGEPPAGEAPAAQAPNANGQEEARPPKWGMTRDDWRAMNDLILKRTDVEAAYREMKVEITGSRPTPKGWLRCRLTGLSHAGLEAVINVGEGAARGRFRFTAGKCPAISLFRFAACFGRYRDYDAARRHFARRAKVKLPRARATGRCRGRGGRGGSAQAPGSAGGQAGGPPTVREKQQEVLDRLELDALGRHDDDSVTVYSRGRGRLFKIRSIPGLSRHHLVLYSGDLAIQEVARRADTKEAGKIEMDDVRAAIAYLAGERNLDQCPVLGVGLWPLDGGIVVVNGRGTARWQGGQLTPVPSPLCGQHVLDFSAQDPWLDVKLLEGYLQQAASPAWARDVLDQAVDLFRLWFWRNKIDAEVAAALAACTFVQTCWPWRPLVALAGASASGKTTLFWLLSQLFGFLTLSMEKVTEAGLRQALLNAARAVLIDEFENDANRPGVLELLRVCGKGGEVFRGTADHRGRRFRMRHLVWTAAIETGLTKEADLNRFIRLDLARPPSQRHGKLALPPEAALNDLGVKLCAVAMRHFDRAADLFGRLKALQIDGAHGRHVENYAVPASMAATVRGLDDVGAAALLETFLAGRGRAGQVPTDEAALLADILGSVIRLDRGNRLRVSEILGSDAGYRKGRAALERYGVGLVSEQQGRKPNSVAALPLLFIDPSAVQRYLLAGTRWEGMDLGQILARADGARREYRRLAGSVDYGVLLPKPDLGGGDTEGDGQSEAGS